MIAETSRKRRRLERERRAVERPQPSSFIFHSNFIQFLNCYRPFTARMIPLPPPLDIHNAILPPPSIRKIIKSYPFGSRKQNKSDTYHHHHSHYPKHLVYPEISTLSSMEISSDVEYLCQYQKRPPSSYDMQHQPPPHSQSQPYPQTGRSGPSLQGIGRSLSMGINGSLGPSQTPHPPVSSSMGPPLLQGHQQHGMGYDQYGDLPPSSYGPPGGPPHPASVGRMRDSSSSYANQGPGGGGGGALPLGPPPPRPSSATLRENMPYPNFPGHGGRSQAASQQHGPYPGDHEMSGVGPGGGGGGGHQLMPHHPYFSSQANASAGGNVHGPSPSSSAAHHHGGNVKGGPMNGRRSISPVPVLPNGAGGGGAKPNGSWMGLGMGMSGFHLERAPSASSKAEWDARVMHEEERERLMMREREQRKREDREREREKDRERDREFERERIRRERDDLERERQREHHHMVQLAQQQHHRQLPGSGGTSSHSGLSHLHGPPPPPQGSGVVPHHHAQHHHHRAPHHHHVVHHHHGQHSSSSVPPPAGANSIMHSPRSTREYEPSRPPPGSFHPGPGQSHTEVITLSSGSKPPPSSLPPREREGHWPTKGSEEGHHHPAMMDYRDRDRERDAMTRDRNERDARKLHSHRHSSGPPMMPLEDRGDRPMATPFTMTSSQTMQHAAAGISSSTHINGSSSTSSPRGAPPWSNNPIDDPSYRMTSSSGAPPPPPGYMGGSSHDRSPVQAHRYPPSSSSHPSHPLARMPNNNNNNASSAYHRMSSPPLPPPSRARPPQSPSYPTSMSNSHRSPVTR